MAREEVIIFNLPSRSASISALISITINKSTGREQTVVLDLQGFLGGPGWGGLLNHSRECILSDMHCLPNLVCEDREEEHLSAVLKFPRLESVTRSLPGVQLTKPLSFDNPFSRAKLRMGWTWGRSRRAPPSALSFALDGGGCTGMSPHARSADHRTFPSALRSWLSSLPPLISLCFTSEEKRSLLNRKPSGQLWLHHVPRSWPKPFVELKR